MWANSNLCYPRINACTNYSPSVATKSNIGNTQEGIITHPGEMTCGEDWSSCFPRDDWLKSILSTSEIYR